MSSVTWSEPEDRRRRASVDFRAIAEDLMAHPGQWGIIAEGVNETRTQASSLALGVRRGKYAAFKPAGAWLSKSSADKVWAKYVGPNLEHATDEERESILAVRAQTAQRAATWVDKQKQDRQNADAEETA